MKFLEALAFAIVYLLTCNWSQIKSFLFALTRPKERISHIYNDWITKTLFKKTGVKLETITIFELKKIFGMMPSTPPFKPSMILSREMYETFNRDELEWVILHEAGHYVLLHGIKLACIQITSLMIGIYILQITHSVIVILSLALLFAFVYIQFGKYMEYQADKYSIAKVDNPNGVVTAQAKLIRSHNIDEKSFFTKYLRTQTLPSQRIALASKSNTRRYF